MLRKVPIVACPIPVSEILRPTSHAREKLIDTLAAYLNCRRIFLANSATSLLYLMFDFLLGRGKKEVILPAYTATSIVHACCRAGMQPVLCDISLNDFNLDMEYAGSLINQNTAAIVAVHGFGIVSDILSLKNAFPRTVIIEDAAQAMGSMLGPNPAASMGDAGILSFNRGKNIPGYGGGCLAVNSENLAEKFKSKIAPTGEKEGILKNSLLAAKIAALALGSKPYVYGAAYPFIRPLLRRAAARRFRVGAYTTLQAKVILGLMQNIKKLTRLRAENGKRIIAALSRKDRIRLPFIAPDTTPAFNRLPIVFESLREKENAQKRLARAGIESSTMYKSPLHHIFNLGYKKDTFPNAVYFAKHLLTVPCHPLLSARDLDTIVNVILET